MNRSPRSIEARRTSNRLHEEATARSLRKLARELELSRVNKSLAEQFKAGRGSELILRRKGTRNYTFTTSSIEPDVSCSTSVLGDSRSDLGMDGIHHREKLTYLTESATASTRASVPPSPVLTALDPCIARSPIPTPSPRPRRSRIKWSELFTTIMYDSTLPT